MSAALVNHLWQSTIFAGCVWVLTLFLRTNGAHVRYAVWLCASIKFLIPFSLLVTLGMRLQPHALEVPNALAAITADELTAMLVSPGRAISVEPAGNIWLLLASSLWFIGFLALVARWLRRWHAVGVLARNAMPTTIVAPVPVRSSAGLREPGVVGIIRPVLMLPAAIEAALTTQQFQAVLDHEINHVRRRDNLTAAIHMLVEAVFWFHPLVWWIGSRLIEERERACDEAVVRSGSEPRVYAEGILRVCRSTVASDLACVSGVSGADLKTRLEAIMRKDDIKELGKGRRIALGALALSALATPVLVGIASPVLAEAAAPQHAVVSVGKIELLAGKRVKLDYQNVDVRTLIRAMGEAANVNILVSDKVSGTVTVKLAEMSWDQAFGIILNSQGLVKREKDGILFVEPASA